MRYSGVTLLLLISLLGVRDGWRYQQVRFAVFLSLSSSCILLSTAPPELGINRGLFVVVRMGDIPAIPLVWIFGRSLFEDGFRFGRTEALAFTLYCCSVMTFRLRSFGFAIPDLLITNLIGDGLTLLMMGHLAYTTLKGRLDDLVERRRRFRVPFVLCLAAISVFTMLAEEFIPQQSIYTLNVTRMSMIIGMALWGIAYLFAFTPENLAFGDNLEQPKKTIPKPIARKDAALAKALDNAMAEDRLYQRQGLTITSLAGHLGYPEHQVRRHINDHIGARNFTQYLNGLRLKEASNRLIALEEQRTPILTIAMDAGFNSLAPFNRAFKSAFGVTPSEYRRLQGEKSH